MGFVYECTRSDTGERVAIKVLSPEYSYDRNGVARFRQEARAVSEIGHPNLVRIYEFGQIRDGRQYFAMEFLRGRSLGHYLERSGPLEPALVLRVVQDVGSALDAAHDCGYIHRDLKPENIFLVMDSTGTPTGVKLLDFGIAKYVETDSRPDDETRLQTRTGGAMGTLQYMSPEQFEEMPADRRSDVYALGVVTFELLTGRLPFVGRSYLDWARKHVSEPAPAPSSFLSTISPEVDAVVLRALEKRPAIRYGSAGELAAALENAYGLVGISAAPAVSEAPGSTTSGSRDDYELRATPCDGDPGARSTSTSTWTPSEQREQLAATEPIPRQSSEHREQLATPGPLPRQPRNAGARVQGALIVAFTVLAVALPLWHSRTAVPPQRSSELPPETWKEAELEPGIESQSSTGPVKPVAGGRRKEETWSEQRRRAASGSPDSRSSRNPPPSKSPPRSPPLESPATTPKPTTPPPAAEAIIAPSCLYLVQITDGMGVQLNGSSHPPCITEDELDVRFGATLTVTSASCPGPAHPLPLLRGVPRRQIKAECVGAYGLRLMTQDLAQDP